MLLETVENAKTTKVRNLNKLSRSFSVPNWFYVGEKLYDGFIEKTGLKNKIAQKLNYLNRANYEEMSADIQKMIAFQEMPHEIEEEILSRYTGNLISVRAAFTVNRPELPEIAFLNISSKSKLINAIKVIFSMKYMTSAMKFKLEENLDFDVEVIVQDMIQSNISCISYSKDIFSNTDNVLIKSCLGLGLPLSNNEITGEVTIVNESGVISKVPFIQEYAYVLNRPKTQTEKINISPNGRYDKLSSDKAKEIYDLSKYIEGMFGTPQKISFAFASDKLFVLSTSSLGFETEVSEELSNEEPEQNIVSEPVSELPEDDFIPLGEIPQQPEEEYIKAQEFIIPIQKDLEPLKNILRELAASVEEFILSEGKEILGETPSDVDEALVALSSKYDTFAVKRLVTSLSKETEEQELKELIQFASEFIIQYF
ncbi:hypothetical protein JXM83_04970 [Candidatus Woesearchaeota archaeon]|nr:hypothetical protein [Candidatus Woesearchaeota archaeon]